MLLLNYAKDIKSSVSVETLKAGKFPDFVAIKGNQKFIYLFIFSKECKQIVYY